MHRGLLPPAAWLQVEEVFHKISLYADNVPMFVSNLETTLSRIINMLTRFSGYMINLTEQ